MLIRGLAWERRLLTGLMPWFVAPHIFKRTHSDGVEDKSPFGHLEGSKDGTFLGLNEFIYLDHLSPT